MSIIAALKNAPKLNFAFVQASLMCWDNEHVIGVKPLFKGEEEAVRVKSEEEIEKGMHLFLIKQGELPKRVMRLW